MRSGRPPPIVPLVPTGCGITHLPADVVAPGGADTDKAPRESSARVNQATNRMGGAGAASHRPTTPGPYVPAGPQRPVSAALTGPLDQAAQAPAGRVGYGFASNDTPGTAPVQVSLSGQPAPVIDPFRGLGAQAGRRADVLVDADRRMVEVRHRA